jgi:hypothetical protein
VNFGDDMIDLEGHPVAILRHLTVFASFLGTTPGRKLAAFSGGNARVGSILTAGNGPASIQVHC